MLNLQRLRLRKTSQTRFLDNYGYQIEKSEFKESEPDIFVRLMDLSEDTNITLWIGVVIS